MWDVYSKVDSYDDSTTNLISLKLTKNEVSLEISNITAYTVYTWWKSNTKRTLLFLRRKYEKLFVVANKNKIIKEKNFALQLSAPLLKKHKKKKHDDALIKTTQILSSLFSLSFHLCILLFFIGFVCGRNVGSCSDIGPTVWGYFIFYKPKTEFKFWFQIGIWLR